MLFTSTRCGTNTGKTSAVAVGRFCRKGRGSLVLGDREVSRTVVTFQDRRPIEHDLGHRIQSIERENSGMVWPGTLRREKARLKRPILPSDPLQSTFVVGDEDVLDETRFLQFVMDHGGERFRLGPRGILGPLFFVVPWEGGEGQLLHSHCVCVYDQMDLENVKINAKLGSENYTISKERNSAHCATSPS